MEIKQDFIEKGRPNRPSIFMKPIYITIHETGNYAVGADAKAHASYLRNTSEKVSWHYTVDDTCAYQHIPDNETAFHAGDGQNGNGNSQSIGIEICVNKDGDFDKACKNTIVLVRQLMKQYKIPIENVVQHNHWNGKNCPANLRIGGWGEFIKECGKVENELTEQEIKALIEASKEKIYHFWKELPKWAYAPIKALYDAGYFTGAGASDLNLSQTKMECLVVMARAFKKQGLISY